MMFKVGGVTYVKRGLVLEILTQVRMLETELRQMFAELEKRTDIHSQDFLEADAKLRTKQKELSNLMDMTVVECVGVTKKGRSYLDSRIKDAMKTLYGEE